MLLLGVAMGVTQPVVAALWAELYGTQSIGAVRSLTTSLMILSSASAPWLFGVLIDRGASDTDLFGGSALIVLLAGLLVLMAFPRSQTQPK
jgi:predicted MFS family arabinose efflux permease